MARALVLGCLWYLLSASIVRAACDCDHYPYRPRRCESTCGAQLLNQASKAELETFLHLDEPLAQRIVELKESRPNETFSTLSDIRPSLPQEDYNKLLQALDNLEPIEAEYLIQAAGKKQEFRDKIMMAKPPEGASGG